jgi:hypothetical protein
VEDELCRIVSGSTDRIGLGSCHKRNKKTSSTGVSSWFLAAEPTHTSSGYVAAVAVAFVVAVAIFVETT